MESTIKRGSKVDLVVSNYAPDSVAVDLEIGEWLIGIWRNEDGEIQIDITGGKNDIENHLILGKEAVET